MKEILKDIKAMERTLTPELKFEIVASLRATRTDLDSRREPKTEWKRGNIYFHALQDTLFAARMARPTDHKVIREVQACFVKDLDDYIERFPADEDPKMKQLFQTVFDAGTSIYWDQDREFIKRFDKAFWELDKQVIRPWAQVGI